MAEHQAKIDEELEQKTPAFVHLHIHSEYSLSDGFIRIDPLLDYVKSLGHTHIAMTDHGNMFGAIDFYSAAKKKKIIPIIGCEIYLEGLESTHFVAKEQEHDWPQVGAFHLVLLAKNNRGYRNLMKLVSAGYGNIREDIPVVSNQALRVLSQDLIALSSCQLGELGYLVRQLREYCGSAPLDLRSEEGPIGLINIALEEHFKTMLEFFGAGQYYVELINNNLPGQIQFLEDLVEVAQFYQAPLVASSDAHYLRPEDKDIHALATAIKNNLTFKDIRRRQKDACFHVANANEMQALYGRWPEALTNTIIIAKQCSDVDIEMGRYYLPRFTANPDESEEESLRRLSKEGLNDRFPYLEKIYGASFDAKQKEIYFDRLAYELEVIVNMGFSGYFLIVQDFINWAKQQDIPVGPGRGSGAGSLVAYALRITDIDPIPYNLIFERFLNPERVSMPDFDVDFCQWRRDEVIQYVTDKYGKDNVAQITTFGKMMAKGAVKSVGRAMNLGFSRVDRFTKLFPNVINISLKDALKEEPRLQQEMDKDDTIREVMDYAFKIEGLTSHTSVHAAGLVISDGPMTDYVPVYSTDGEHLITQYEMKKAEKVGLVKFDFLGLKTLTVIKKAVEYIQLKAKPDFQIETISLADSKVFTDISFGSTCGIFQLESSGMTQLVKKLKPSCFEDIIALVALFRPGPLGSGMVDDFVERKHGRQEISYQHHLLEPILKDTYGMILYQEQVQKIAADLAKYSLGEADLLRRAMGKKIPEEMAQQKSRFLSGAIENEIDPKVAEEIFDTMAEFANYGFNKSHSAAYGLVSYQTAFLKTHYTEEFMAAIMTCDLDNTSKLVRYIEDCQSMGFTINPPDINLSDLNFKVAERRTIQFGLAAIKGIGESALKPLIQERQANGPFLSISDLCRRINLALVGKKNLELLIQAGAFDRFQIRRKDLFGAIRNIVEFNQRQHEAKSSGQMTLFDMLGSQTVAADDRGAPWESLRSVKPGKKPWDFEDLYLEKKILGAFISGHPLHFYRNDFKVMASQAIKNFPAIADQNDKRGKNEKVQIGVLGMVATHNIRRTKKGTLIAGIKIEQEQAIFEAMMFEKALEKAKIPDPETPAMFYGSVDKNFDHTSIRFTIDRIIPLENVRQQRVKGLLVKLNVDPSSDPAEEKTTIESLKGLLASHPGDKPVLININFAKAIIRFTTSLKANISNLFLRELEDLSPNISYDLMTKIPEDHIPDPIPRESFSSL